MKLFIHIFLIIYIFVFNPIYGQNKSKLDFDRCVQRIVDNNGAISNDKHIDFCLSLDSIGRFGIVNYMSFLNYEGMVRRLPDINAQVVKWNKWRDENDFDWNTPPSIYDMALDFIIDSLSEKKDYYSNILIINQNEEVVIKDCVYLKEMDGITNTLNLKKKKKVKILKNLVSDTLNNYYQIICYYKIHPALVDDHGDIFVYISEFYKNVLNTKMSNEIKLIEQDPINEPSISSLYKLYFKFSKEDKLKLIKSSYEGERISIR